MTTQKPIIVTLVLLPGDQPGRPMHITANDPNKGMIQELLIAALHEITQQLAREAKPVEAPPTTPPPYEIQLPPGLTLN